MRPDEIPQTAVEAAHRALPGVVCEFDEDRGVYEALSHPDPGSGLVARDEEEVLRDMLAAALPHLMPAEGLAGVALIAAERQRQIDAEGWTSEHDDEHTLGELGMAAACYAMPGRNLARDGAPLQPPWPWAAVSWKPSPGDRVRELAKAGALIAAEIDRLQRREVRDAR